MTSRLALALAALAAIAAAPTPLADHSLAGRTAGKPQRCLGVPGGKTFTTAEADPQLVLYDDGKTVWANRLGAACGFEPGEMVIADQPAPYYCNGDFVRQGKLVELSPFARRCTLGNFVPYRTPK